MIGSLTSRLFCTYSDPEFMLAFLSTIEVMIIAAVILQIVLVYRVSHSYPEGIELRDLLGEMLFSVLWYGNQVTLKFTKWGFSNRTQNSFLMIEWKIKTDMFENKFGFAYLINTSIWKSFSLFNASTYKCDVCTCWYGCSFRWCVKWSRLEKSRMGEARTRLAPSNTWDLFWRNVHNNHLWSLFKTSNNWHRAA